MYKYYKNIGLKGEQCGEVLKVIMNKIWDFLTETCHNNVNGVPTSTIEPVNYDLDYHRRLDQHHANNLIDPLLQGNQLFGSKFSLSYDANQDYQNIAFSFGWLKYPVIMYVPKSLYSYLYGEYDLLTKIHGIEYTTLPYICFTFNPTIFYRDPSDPGTQTDPYTQHNIYEKISYDSKQKYSYIDRHYGGLTYNDCITSVYPIWIINPFSPNNYLNVDSYSNTIKNDMSMFIALEDHSFIMGFVNHSDIDEVHYSFISGMPDKRTLSGCDFEADFLVRSDILAYKQDIDHDTFIFSVSSDPDDIYSSKRTSQNISIMAVNATVDSNVVGDLLFPSGYAYNTHSYKNVPMFDNYERTCWVNRFLPETDDYYFLAGKDGNILDKTIKVPTLSINLQTEEYPYVNGGTVVTPSTVPGYRTSSSDYISYNNDPTYHEVMFPTAERNTLNSHIVLFPAFVCVRREPVNDLEEYSPLCRLDFIVRTNTMYHHNKGIFELNIDNSNYLVYSDANKSYNIGILVSRKLEPAI